VANNSGVLRGKEGRLWGCGCTLKRRSVTKYREEQKEER